MKLLTFFSVFLIATHVSFAVTTPSKNCVLEEAGVESCTSATAALPAIARQSVPCEKMDMKCWCMKAVEYTNDVRRRRGQRKMLKVGPMKQLDNAVRYAGVLGDKGFLQHQQLSQATKEIGCGRFVGGENIAFNFERGDAAKACLNQWEGSSGHLQNILRDSFEEVVVGFHFEPDGRVYCVQTFTMSTSFGTSGSRSDPGCEPVRAGSAPKPKPTRPAATKPTPTKPAATKPAPTKPASTKPAPTKPAPTKPAPTTRPKPKGKPNISQKMKDEANRSCRCIELGHKCWFSLHELSGKRCKSFTAARKQSKACRTKCCGYCKFYPNTPPCMSERVKRICRRLRRESRSGRKSA